MLLCLCASFSRADRPPYVLLLEVDNAKRRLDFATFYDPIFAKVCEENDTKYQAISSTLVIDV